MVAPASQMYQSWSPEQGLAGLADLSSRPSSPLLSGAISPTPPRSDPWEWQNPEAQEVFKNQSPENLAASKRPGFLGFGSAGNAIFEDTGEFKDSLRSRGIGPQGSMVGVPPGGVGATVMSYFRRKKPDGTYEYHQTGNTAEPVPSGEGWERSSQEFSGQHGDIDPEWRKEWEKKYGKPDISRPDVPTLNPSMPGFVPRPGLTLTGPNLVPRPDPSLNPFQPPVQQPVPPSPPVSPRPEPQPGIQFPQLPTGQQVSNLVYSEGPALNPPSIRLKHGGSLTDKVLRILRNLS